VIGRHVLAAVLAGCLLGGGVASASWYVRWLEGQSIHALAPMMFALKNQGTDLQAEAFRHADLLVVYGSSELEQPNRYHASNLFQDYPTGFTIFPVGRGSTTSLVMLQDLAAVGSELHGKKVVISVSPPWFQLHDRTPNFYATNHSALHVSALVFSTDLSFETKQAATRQLMQSPTLFASDPLVDFAAHRLVEDGPLNRAQYLATLPLGKLQHVVMEAQDRWATYAFLQSRQPDPHSDAPVSPPAVDIHWSGLIQTAEAEQQNHASNNEFGFDNAVWVEKYARLVAQRHQQFSDSDFIDNLQHTAEFVDLDILLRGLSELGADALVLSQPLPGAYYDYVGVSAAARAQYYARLRDVAAAYDVPVVDFADHDGDKYFVTDPNSHLSRKGWTYYDRALDAFYHGNLGELASTEWGAGALLPGDSARAAAAVR
jgi:D-alanine transfer protein